MFAGSRVVTKAFTPAGERPSSDVHGTAVAALLVGDGAGNVPGLMSGAQLYAADAFYRDEEGNDVANAVSLLESLNWLATRQVSVVNLSLAGPANTALASAIEQIDTSGVVVVAAAGNNGPSAPPVYPAAYPTVIAVTAVDGRLRPYRRANRGDYLTLAAPGVKIWAASGADDGKYHYGTSFAVPFAAAVVADLVARSPQSGPAYIRRTLVGGVQDLGDPGKDPIYGWGLVRAPTACAG